MREPVGAHWITHDLFLTAENMTSFCAEGRSFFFCEIAYSFNIEIIITSGPKSWMTNGISIIPFNEIIYFFKPMQYWYSIKSNSMGYCPYWKYDLESETYKQLEKVLFWRMGNFNKRWMLWRQNWKLLWKVS